MKVYVKEGLNLIVSDLLNLTMSIPASHRKYIRAAVKCIGKARESVGLLDSADPKFYNRVSNR